MHIIKTAIILALTGGLLVSFHYHKLCFNHSDTNKTISCLRSFPAENIEDDETVKSYLKKHKVYIVLTTSPRRIKKLKPVLEALNTDFVDKIFLVLPNKFKRNKKHYIVPDYIKRFENLEVLRIKEDLGPITKLLPAVAYINNNEENRLANIEFKDKQPLKTPDPNAIIITIDDDIGYHNDTIPSLIKYSILTDAVVSSAGSNLRLHRINREHWPTSQNFYLSDLKALTRKDIVEGFGAIAYKAKHVDVRAMKYLSRYSKNCFATDDIVISWVLAYNQIARFQVSNNHTRRPVPLSYGFENDALHKAQGDGKSKEALTRNYGKCAKDAAKFFF